MEKESQIIILFGFAAETKLKVINFDLLMQRI